ncbi:reverse transcriptase domain-containing protein [Tanacetum coccineum]
MTTRERQEEKAPYSRRLGSRGRSAFAHSDSPRKFKDTENTLKAMIVKGTLEIKNQRRPEAAAKTEMWVMPTWCHMFNSTLTGNARVWFDDLPPESIDSYNDLREAFLKKYLPTKNAIIDPIVLHNIKQRDGEFTEDFKQRYKSESGNVKGAPECMRISRFVHGITNPELIKRFHKKIPKTVDEMMQVATSFLQGQEAVSNQERKKAPPAWKHQKGVTCIISRKKEAFAANISKRRGRIGLPFSTKKRPREILALRKSIKFKTHVQCNPPVEKGGRKHKQKFANSMEIKCKITDECNHLRRQIEDMLKAGKLSHIINELKQNSVKDQQKKKGETSGKEKPQSILMIQSWQKIVRQKISQSFSPNLEISFPSLEDDEGTEGPLIIEAEIGGHQVHRIPELRKIHAVPSTAHGMIKFQVTRGILTLRSSKIIPIECAMVSGLEDQPFPVNKVKEERVKVAINPEHPEQTVMIGSNLTEKARVKMCNLLQRSLDVFTWTPADMTGVPRHIAEHRLNVREGCQLIRQKKRGQAAERNIAINDEVSKLVATGIMREVHYHNWLSNPVMVKKHDNGWRMCVDFKDLNKSCPKDGYPLSEIDWKVESLCGFPFKCFLDAYKGYHQIQMAEKDKEKPQEAEAAFRQMKEQIAKLPILTSPEEQKELIIYLAASNEAVSAVLMTKREARQMPIYFVSRVLRGPEVNYTSMKKLVLALVDASKRLKRYFKAHPIIVVMDQPIKNILSNPEVAGRMQKWSIQLGEFGIHYRPRISVKGQVLADFIVERPEEEGQDDSTKEEEPIPARWTLFTDESSCVDGCGAGVILTDPEGENFTYALRFQFKATNNEAEYEALIAVLRIAEKIGIQNLQVNVDSKLVANQQVPRSKNKKADALSKIASTSFAHLSKHVLVEELKEKSVNEIEVLAVVEEEGDSWMTLIHEYLTDETLLAERRKARVIK